jgi:hypothetical protein
MDALKTGRTGAAVGPADELVPAPVLAKEFGVTRRTLGRWFVDPRLNFPPPVEINGRLYSRRPEIERWKLERPLASQPREEKPLAAGRGLTPAEKEKRKPGRPRKNPVLAAEPGSP